MDRDLVEQARSGDQAAFADLVHQVRAARDRSAHPAHPGLAEDVLQNALVTMWRKLPHMRETDRFEA
jgi:DNA-directed RNA polymerase specialized sigma24 family protein